MLRGRFHVFPHGSASSVMSEGDFRAHVEEMVALASRLIDGYDRERADVVLHGGEEAGHLWDDALLTQATARRRKRGMIRGLVFSSFALLIVVIVAAVLVGSGLL